MPSFDTTGPISVNLDLISANIRINASDRIDTVVEVRPANEAKKHDVNAADQTQVSFHNGTLTVKTAKPKPILGGKGTIELIIDLPTGSRLKGESAVTDLQVTGELGETRFSTATGELNLAKTGPAHLDNTNGRITVNHITGHAELTAGAGEVWVHTIDGTAVVKTSNGTTTLGTVTGDLRVNVANGDTTVEKAHNSVVVKAAAGSIRVGETTRGSAVLETNVGDIEIGIRPGTAAYLDLKSLTGRLINDLAATVAPQSNDETIKVHARTVTGDLIVRRTAA